MEVVDNLSWPKFVKESIKLFRSNPEKTRYLLKYKHSEGIYVIKVTDDKKCFKFRMDEPQGAKTVERLNNVFFILMAKGPEANVDLAEVIGKEQVMQSARKAGKKKK